MRKRGVLLIFCAFLFCMSAALSGCGRDAASENWDAMDLNEVYEYIESHVDPYRGDAARESVCAADVLGHDRDHLYLYVFTAYYDRSGGSALSHIGGSLFPLSLEVAFGENGAEICGHSVPMDGEKWNDSIQKIFPSEIQEKIARYSEREFEDLAVRADERAHDRFISSGLTSTDAAPSSGNAGSAPTEPEGQETDADDAWMQALANAYLPRESRESPPDPEKDYGLTFYLGLIQQNFDLFSRGVWSIAPAGTEDWVYLDSHLGMKGGAYCTFTHDSDEKLNYPNAAHGCTEVHKMYGDIDGCVSEKWRLRLEIFPFEEFWIFYREGDSLYSCYIWEDVTITGDNTLVRINRDWEKNTGEVKDAMEILALTTTTESLPIIFCKDCPKEWDTQ